MRLGGSFLIRNTLYLRKLKERLVKLRILSKVNLFLKKWQCRNRKGKNKNMKSLNSISRFRLRSFWRLWLILMNRLIRFQWLRANSFKIIKFKRKKKFSSKRLRRRMKYWENRKRKKFRKMRIRPMIKNLSLKKF